MTDTRHTIEDVDAELQPKGLQCLTLTEPAWLGPWHQETPRVYMRSLVKLCRTIPASCHVTITQRTDGQWSWNAGQVANAPASGISATLELA